MAGAQSASLLTKMALKPLEGNTEVSEILPPGLKRHR
jgi:hypothetical protein